MKNQSPYDYLADRRDLAPFSLRLACCLMLWLAALYLGFCSDLPQLPVVAGIGGITLLCLRRAMVMTDRTIIYGVLALFMLVVLAGQLWGLDTGRLGLFAYFFRPEYYGHFLLLLPFLAGILGGRSLLAGMTLQGVIFAIGTCGDIRNPATLQRSQYFPAGFIADSYEKIYFLVIVVEMLLGFLVLLLAQRRRQLALPGLPKESSVASAKPSRLPKIYYALGAACLVLLGMAIAGAFQFQQLYSQEIRNLEIMVMSFTFRNLHPHQYLRRAAPVFLPAIDLTQPFPLSGHRRRARNIVLRVTGPAAPGLLRLHTLADYSHGHWQKGNEGDEITLSLSAPDGVLNASTFSLVEKPEEETPLSSLATWEILPTSNLYLDALPVLANFQSLTLVADELHLTQDGEVTATGWKRQAGYQLTAPPPAVKELSPPAFPLPQADASLTNISYRRVPPYLQKTLTETLATVPGWQKASTDAEKIQALLDFFAANFTYRLPVRREWYDNQQQSNLEANGHLTDPTADFLLRTRTGHCELFASALTLLLRSAGIPARCLTGFRCEEKHPSGKFYIARLGQAHAWTEAFDRQQQRWVTLDATPGGQSEDEASRTGFLAAFWEHLKYSLSKGYARILRGELAQAVADCLAWLWVKLCSAWGLAVAVLLGLAVIVLWLCLHRRKTRRLSLTESQRLWARNFQRRQRHWARLAHCRFKPSQTAREILASLAAVQDFPPAELQAARKFLAEYELARFGETPIPPF
jgi:transglutaminase-like putative cysteine protease